MTLNEYRSKVLQMTETIEDKFTKALQEFEDREDQFATYEMYNPIGQVFQMNRRHAIKTMQNPLLFEYYRLGLAMRIKGEEIVNEEVMKVAKFLDSYFKEEQSGAIFYLENVREEDLKYLPKDKLHGIVNRKTIREMFEVPVEIDTPWIREWIHETVSDMQQQGLLDDGAGDLKTAEAETVEIKQKTPEMNNKRKREGDDLEDLSTELMSFTDDIPDESVRDPRKRNKREIKPEPSSLLLTQEYPSKTTVLPSPTANPKHRFYKKPYGKKEDWKALSEGGLE